MLLGKSGKFTKHTTDEGELDERLGRLRKEVIFAVEPPIKRQPREAALHHPALLDDHEAAMTTEGFDLVFGQLLSLWKPKRSGIGIGALNDFDAVSKGRFDPALPLALISTIGKEVEFHLRLFVSQLLEELLTAFSIGDVRRQDLDPEQEPQGIDDQMVLASVDLFASVVSSSPPFCEVFTLLESTIPALGTAFLPSTSRT